MKESLEQIEKRKKEIDRKKQELDKFVAAWKAAMAISENFVQYVDH
jgi:hypothetical protein